MKICIITGIILLLIALVYSCQSDDSIVFKQYYSSGAQVYHNHCQNCHGDKGEGLAAVIPPLTRIVSIKNFKDKLPCILQNGLKGKVTVAGREFDGNMAPSGLTPIEIAEVATYINNSFGNKLGIVTGDDVNSALAKCN